MQYLKNISLLLALVALTACGGGGGSSSTAKDDPETIEGRVVQGPVGGSLVIADKIPANFLIDVDSEKIPLESSTFTDADGYFHDLVIPENYGEYVLVTFGGYDFTLQRPAIPMMAPPGVEHITPLTTLVAQTSGSDRAELIASIEDLGVAYDFDPSEGQVPVGFLSLTKIVEETMVLATQYGVVKPEDQALIARHLAQELKNTDVSTPDVQQDAVAAAVATVLPELEEQGSLEVRDDDALTSLAEVFDQMGAAVSAAVFASATDEGTVAENPELVSALDKAKDKVETEDVYDQLNLVLIRLDDCRVFDTDGNTISSDYSSTYGIDVDPHLASILEFDFNVYNNRDEQSEVDYPDVRLELSIYDLNSRRSTRFILTGIDISTGGSDGTELSFDQGKANIRVVASNSAGNSIDTKKELSFATDTDLNTMVEFGTDNNSNRLVFDLDALQDKFARDVAEEFGDISLPGSYAMSLRAENFPLVPVSINVNAQEPPQ